MNKTTSLQLDIGVYQGQANSKNQPSGFGKLAFKNGNCFEGEWLNGDINGNGKFNFSSGNIYIGKFLCNVKNGFGTFFYVNAKEKYQGFWKNDLKHGKGKYFHANGNVFQGIFKNDKKNGFGKIYSKDFVFSGTWINGKKHGIFKRESLVNKSVFLIKYNHGKKVEITNSVLKTKTKTKYTTKENYKIDKKIKNTLSIVEEEIQKEDNTCTSIYSKNKLMLFNDTTSIFSSNYKLHNKKYSEKQVFTLTNILDHSEETSKNKYQLISKSLTCFDTNSDIY